MEFLDSDTYVDYFQVIREQPEIFLQHNRYYNEEAPAFKSYQNSLVFYVVADVTPLNSDSTPSRGQATPSAYRISSKFTLPHRVRQIDHQNSDLAEVKLPLYTRIYTNALSSEFQKTIDYEDSCLFKFWQETYLGTFFSNGEFESTFKVIIPNSKHKWLADISTIGGVALAMLFTLWIVFSAQSPDQVILGGNGYSVIPEHVKTE